MRLRVPARFVRQPSPLLDGPTERHWQAKEEHHQMPQGEAAIPCMLKCPGVGFARFPDYSCNGGGGTRSLSVTMDGLFSNTARDVIAALGLALAIFQTILSLRYSRAALSSGDVVTAPGVERFSARQSFSRIVRSADVRNSWRLFICTAFLTCTFSFVIARSLPAVSWRQLPEQLLQAEHGSSGVVFVLLACSTMFQSIALFGWVSGSYFALGPSTCNKKAWTGFLSAVSAAYMVIAVCLFRFAGGLLGLQIFALTQMFTVAYAFVLGLILSALGWALFKFFPYRGLTSEALSTLRQPE